MNRLDLLQYFGRNKISKFSISLLIVLVGSVGLDQTSKFQVQNDLVVFEKNNANVTEKYFGKSIPIGKIGKRSEEFYFGLKFTYARNKGAAFSMLSNLDDIIRIPFFYIVHFIATFIIFYYLVVTPKLHIFFRFGLIMILSGAIGNFIDRFQYGYVVDFIDIDWKLFGWYHNFAIFNIADIAVNIGVIFIFTDIYLMRDYQTITSPLADTPE